MDDFKPIAGAARYIWGFAGTFGIVAVGLISAAGLAYTFGPRVFIAAAVVIILATALWWWVSGRRWRSWGYAERERDLVIKRGVLVRRETIVPYGRMQFVEMKQGPFDRLIGTYEIQLHTAAAATDARIPLLPEPEALRLRERLTELGEAYAAGI